jgi:LemA protein
MATIISSIIGVLIFILIVYVFNRFVSNRNHVKDAWSNIDVFLKKRYDLVPLLINTVKGYAQHEQHTFEKIAHARAKAMSIPEDRMEDRARAENELTFFIHQIDFIQENYPELKADFSFLQLQKQLSEIELDLEKSRRYYNACVRENNTFGERFPASILASLLYYTKFNYFSAQSHEKDVKDVKI